MSFFASYAIGFLGFIAGMLLFTGVMRWIATLYEIAKDPSTAGKEGKGLRIALATAFGSGPWLLVAAIGGIYFTYTEPYGTALFIGAILAIIFFGGITLYYASKIKAYRVKDPVR